MRVAMVSPLPPARTGVAHYVSMLLPPLRRRVEVDAFETVPPPGYEQVIYQLGNNPYHETAYAEAMRRPGVVVLHDVVLHHLIVEMTLARGDVEGYVASLRASHGDAGEAWARGRAAGLHSEMGNFLLPGSIDLARRSKAVIVHNRWAANVLQSFGVDTPVHVVPHPFEEPRAANDGAALRNQLGIRRDEHVVGLFGFLTSAKRGEIVVEAFRIARERDPRLRLLIVGEPAPNIDMRAIAGDGVITTGFVPDEEFDAYYAVADRLVNLRYPSAGETSGTLIRAFAAGKPVAVSDYAQFAEFPDSCVVRIAFGDGEAERLAGFMTEDFDVARIAKAQRAWLAENASIEKTVDGYLGALEGVRPVAASRPGSGRSAAEAAGAPLSLFANVSIVEATRAGDEVQLTLRNDGASTLRARVYGEPAYRLIVKQFAGETEVFDRWIALDGDLGPDAQTKVVVPLRAGATRLELHHALQGIPIIDTRPAVALELSRVR